MHSKSFPRLLLAWSFLLTLSATTAFAQSIALPTPTPPVVVDMRPNATFVFADATQVVTRSSTGRFRLVGLHPNETVDVAVLFPVISRRSSAGPLSLDGGKIISVSTSPTATGGLALIRFQAGGQPGFYRVLVPGFGASARLQFWVTDPNNPNAAMNAMVLNPNH
jgi:hypothetical protein